jgi:uncharacterized protein YjbI with pentapeptide repeats
VISQRTIQTIKALFLGLCLVVPAHAGESTSRERCSGIFRNGGRPTPSQLSRIIKEHSLWLSSDADDDEMRANLCNADLRRAKLRGVNLSEANLAEANLTGAILAGADLSAATMTGANLTEANLTEAILSKAELTGAILSEATLNGATLTEADLRKAKLVGAKLTEAILISANLSDADMLEASMSKANLAGAVINRVSLRKADLRSTNLRGANLSDADMTGADLSESDLLGANLTNATLIEASLNKAIIAGADLTQAIFELKGGALPEVSSAALAKNLSGMFFISNPGSFVELREEFRKKGLRKQERELTFAIMHTRRLLAWEEDLLGKIESAFQFIFFELTCQYGLAPNLALKNLGMLILICSIPYMIALRTRGRGAIWAVRPKDRVIMGRSESIRVRVTDRPIRFNLASGTVLSFVRRELWMLRIGIYFSLLSAFQIGWREINLGHWIARMQSREYLLRATGWVRVISGVQSLISVYLLALWVLTYFGRPFE